MNNMKEKKITLIKIRKDNILHIVSFILKNNLNRFYIYREYHIFGLKDKNKMLVNYKIYKKHNIDILNEGIELLRKYANEYILKGFTNLKNFTQKDINELEKNQILSYIYNNKNINNHKFMEYSKEMLCVSKFEKNLLVAKNVNGIRCFVYFKDGKIFIKNSFTLLTIDFISNNKYLMDFFYTRSNKEYIFDCVLFCFGLNEIDILKVIKNKTQPFYDNIFLYVYDIVLPINFLKRNKMIEKIKDNFSFDDKINFIHYEKKVGWVNIDNYRNKAVLSIYNSIIIKSPNKKYQEGTCSIKNCCVLNGYFINIATIIDIVKDFNLTKYLKLKCLLNSEEIIVNIPYNIIFLEHIDKNEKNIISKKCVIKTVYNELIQPTYILDYIINLI